MPLRSLGVIYCSKNMIPAADRERHEQYFKFNFIRDRKRSGLIRSHKMINRLSLALLAVVGLQALVPARGDEGRVALGALLANYAQQNGRQGNRLIPIPIIIPVSHLVKELHGYHGDFGHSEKTCPHPKLHHIHQRLQHLNHINQESAPLPLLYQKDLGYVQLPLPTNDPGALYTLQKQGGQLVRRVVRDNSQKVFEPFLKSITTPKSYRELSFISLPPVEDRILEIALKATQAKKN